MKAREREEVVVVQALDLIGAMTQTETEVGMNQEEKEVDTNLLVGKVAVIQGVGEAEEGVIVTENCSSNLVVAVLCACLCGIVY